MSNVYVITDSTADIPLSVREELQIRSIPLKVHFGEEVFLDGVTIHSKEFYARLAQVDKLPTTSQPSPADFLEIYKEILENDPEAEIISIHLSSALSGTYQSAVLAKALLEDQGDSITIIDSMSASYGLGYMAVSCAKSLQLGNSKEQCISLVEEIKRSMKIYFVVDTLEYLKMGGRIGKAAALFGSMLNIKPILTIDADGEVASVDKMRGEKKAMQRMADLLSDSFDADTEVLVNIPHSEDLAKAERIADLLKQRFNVTDLSYTNIGPVIGTHVGQGTVAVMMDRVRHG